MRGIKTGGALARPFWERLLEEDRGGRSIITDDANRLKHSRSTSGERSLSIKAHSEFVKGFLFFLFHSFFFYRTRVCTPRPRVAESNITSTRS